ncbi:MAG: peptide ABC transporter substrate-binding protein [Candidatus Limnocylindrales bacterium]
MLHRRAPALATLVVLIAAACGSGTATPTTGQTATATASPAPTVTASPVDITKTSYKPTAPTGTTGGTIVLAEWQSPDSVNPYYGSAFTNIESFGAMSFDGLVNLTYDLGYVPDLASEVPTVANGDVVVSGNKFDVTYKLKAGMKWSDGNPISCTDLEATWKWIMDKDNTGLAAGTSGWEDITGIDGGSGTTCVVHFGKIYEGYLALFAPVLPAAYITTIPVKDAVSKLYPLAHPEQGVYSGPYIPTEYKADASITFVPNAAWSAIGVSGGSGHAPYLDKVIFKLYGDAESMIKGFTAGEVDVAMDLNDADIPSVADVPADQKLIHDSLSYELHAYNNKSLKEKYADDYLTIIKALRLATDREAIAAGPLQGNVTVTNNFVSPLTWYYKDIGGSTKADPVAAEKLLTDAGWAKGSDGYLAKAGKTLELSYCTTTRQVRVDTLTLVAAQLKAIGVKAGITSVPANPNMFGGWNNVPADTKCNTAHGNYDVAEHGYISPLDPLGGYSTYHSSQIPDAPPHNGSNETRIALPELDAAYDAMKNTVDFTKVQAAMATVQDIYGSDKNSYELPLYLRKDVWLVNPKLQNFTGNPSTVSSQWNIGDWWLQP